MAKSHKRLTSDDHELLTNKYMTDNEAAVILQVSPATVQVYKDTGRIPSEIAPNGSRMLLRAAVEAYSQTFYPDSQKPIGTCEECGQPYQRSRYTSGNAKDKENGPRYFRDGGLCPECKQAAKNGGVRENRVTSTYQPHSGGQWDVHNSLARYKIINAGARWGKDRCSINEFIRKFAKMLSEDRGPELVPKVHGFLVAPNFGLSRQLWREVKQFFPTEWVEQIYEGDKIILTKGGGVIEVKSADDPNALVSVGLDIVLVTEAARIPNLEEVWAYLYGRVQSPGRGPEGNGGIVMANSTPKGKNFWYNLTRMGRKGDDLYDPDFETFTHPTTDNPYIRKADIEKARKLMSDRLFRQEYLAEFLDEADAVFTNVDECGNYHGVSYPEPGEVYKLAWDPAKSVDYSTVGVRNSRGETVEIHRWTGVSWQGQLERVRDVSIKYNFAPVCMDATGLGQTLPEALTKMGLDVEAVVFNNALKDDIVNHLAFLMEQRAISYPNHEALKQELKDFKYTISEKGVIRYSAPRGGHDDLVTMLMLLYKDFNQAEAELPFFGIFTSAGTQKGKIVPIRGRHVENERPAPTAPQERRVTAREALGAILQRLAQGTPVPWATLAPEDAEWLDRLLAEQAAQYLDWNDPMRAQLCLIERQKYQEMKAGA